MPLPGQHRDGTENTQPGGGEPARSCSGGRTRSWSHRPEPVLRGWIRRLITAVRASAPSDQCSKMRSCRPSGVVGRTEIVILGASSGSPAPWSVRSAHLCQVPPHAVEQLLAPLPVQQGDRAGPQMMTGKSRPNENSRMSPRPCTGHGAGPSRRQSLPQPLQHARDSSSATTSRPAASGKVIRPVPAAATPLPVARMRSVV